MTEKFPLSASTPSPMLVGVVYEDLNDNGRHDIGEGFWVNSDQDQDQPLELEGPASSETSVSLTQGWNLKGLKQDYTATVNELINSIDEPVVSLWKWSTSAKSWLVSLPGEDDGGDAYAVSKGFTPLTEISPGEGFWVNVE